ncbi:MAG: class C beta-lactamase-related serine hydrolase [Verrucomicrobia bacterium TMED71]|nr:MAG: class C beta-lactamase-related serine hydrolase [Verrucomicrobia bacterium TMED71]
MLRISSLIRLTVGFSCLGDFVHAADLYFPTDTVWETIDPGSAGWDVNGLEELLEFAREQRSTGIVILQNGRILAERYWEIKRRSKDSIDRLGMMTSGFTSDGQSIEDVASVQKSVVAFLAGVAEGKGLIDLQEPVSKYLGEGWSKSSPEQEIAITVKHLLSMSTGLSESLEHMGDADKIWMYNTPAYSQSIGVLEVATSENLNDLTAKWLTTQIGMHDSKWWDRPWTNSSASSSVGFTTSALDLARFGLMILAEGKWNDEDLLGNPTFIRRALSPSQSINESYGYLWWLNGGETVGGGRNNTKMRRGPLIPSAPKDLVAAQGLLNRKCYVVPSLALVVSRLGDEPPVGRNFNEKFWGMLIKASRG